MSNRDEVEAFDVIRWNGVEASYTPWERVWMRRLAEINPAEAAVVHELKGLLAARFLDRFSEEGLFRKSAKKKPRRGGASRAPRGSRAKR